ncbi:hypothetical protein RE474_13100 [Methanolobus sediminis]|uniref:Uncharacterized protein n=1 Tax=Methanolobus sediminis TaxID=3072978 RepID=A0AA51YIX9_9EURY|nr:hypothetical protein [Methanolobus sediminis]WMW25000.1 hypothetical protein RE474_13100 [Methanolobus sediminis]
MNKLFIFFMMALFLTSAGCTEVQNNTNENAVSDTAIVVYLSYGAFTLPEMAVQELVVNLTAVNLSYYNYQNELTARYVKSIDQETRDNLISLLNNNSFMEMNDQYEPQEGQTVVADTGTVEIQVIQSDASKIIKIDPYSPEYMPEKLREINAALIELKQYAMTPSENEVKETASQWIMSAPTYSFDGSDLALEDYQVSTENPGEYTLNYTFTSSHGGYGNRSDQMVTQVITEHSIEVVLYNRNVIFATIDDVWDEVNQVMLEKTVTMKSQEMNCSQTPWQTWYADGNINFFKEPTEEELVIAYFGTVYNIEVSDLSQTSLDDGNCQYTIKVKESAVETLTEMGWQEA